MVAPKSPASNKSANADAKKKNISNSQTKRTPIKKSKVAAPNPSLKSKKMPALKTQTLKSKANPAVAVKKVSPLKKNEMAKKTSTLKTSKAPSKKISLKRP